MKSSHGSIFGEVFRATAWAVVVVMFFALAFSYIAYVEAGL
jgi:hypothetical protein